MRFLAIAGLIALAAAGSVGAQGANTVKKIDVPMPLNTQACNGSCLEYVTNGYAWTVVARDPTTGKVVNATTTTDIPPNATFGRSTISVNMLGDAQAGSGVKPMDVVGTPPPPPPSGNGTVTVSTPVYGSDAQVTGYEVTTWVFVGGVVSNASSVYITTRPK